MNLRSQEDKRRVKYGRIGDDCASGPEVAHDGSFSDALVELPDLAATFLDMAGVEVPEDWDARSFLEVLRKNANMHRVSQVSILNNRKMIFDGKMKLINGEGVTELYDLRTDPEENANLSDSHAEEVGRMHKMLQGEIELRSVQDRAY